MKKVWNIVLDIVIWLFLAFAVIMTFMIFTAQSNSQGVPSIGGKMIFTIQTESMKPTLKPGDMIFVEKVSDVYSTLKEDDIITFYMDDGQGNTIINTHRIIKVNKNEDGFYTYITKGDNNTANDFTEAGASDIIGIYKSRIPGLGNVVDFLQTKVGFFICVVLPLIAFFIYELIRFIMVVIDEKNKSGETPALDEEEIKKKAIEEYLAKQKAEAEATVSAEAEKVETEIKAAVDTVAETAEEKTEE